MLMEDTKYDVLLLFNGKDNSHIRPINEALLDAGIKTRFLEWSFKNGASKRSFDDQGTLEDLGASSCVAVFLRSNGWGPTQKKIIKQALSLQKRIIPVILS